MCKSKPRPRGASGSGLHAQQILFNGSRMAAEGSMSVVSYDSEDDLQYEDSSDATSDREPLLHRGSSDAGGQPKPKAKRVNGTPWARSVGTSGSREYPLTNVVAGTGN